MDFQWVLDLAGDVGGAAIQFTFESLNLLISTVAWLIALGNCMAGNC